MKQICYHVSGNEFLSCVSHHFQLSLYDKIPAPEEMTFEMMTEYFPNLKRDGEKPSMWPHIPMAQVGNPNHFG